MVELSKSMLAFRQVCGLAAPFLVGALVMATGGCSGSQASGSPLIGTTDVAAVVSARFAVAPSKGEARRKDGWAARVGAPRELALLSATSPPRHVPLEGLGGDAARALASGGLCRSEMQNVDDAFCVDRFEASLVEILPNGEERAWSPYRGVEGHTVRAVSRSNVIPQGYISGTQAAEACARSGKRLCKPREWRKACKGPSQSVYGYGNRNEPQRCNDYGRGPVTTLFGREFNATNQKGWTWDRMNRPELNQLSGTVAPSGSHAGCTNGYGVYDMVGNLHEWVADPEGTFQGGYYQDTHINGDGCDYTTKAHASWYHDYSTGFRCCADANP